jgi:CubicO group peptidase (beta-lactamase class C family)
LSKMFLEAAIQTLYTSGKLLSSTTVYPLLGYKSTPDPRLQQITVDQLLSHYGGLNVAVSNFDPVYSMRQIALAQHTGSAPAKVKDVVEYMSKYTLDSDPGTEYAYSNYGYLLLSYVIEKVTGKAYYDYLNQAVLVPGGFDVRKWNTPASAHVNDPVTQESQYTGLNAMTPLSSINISAIYGGDGMVKEDTYAAASLAASATTLVNFIHTHCK